MNNNLYLIFREIFYSLTVALLIFILIEIIFPNIVQAHISLNLVLILWLLSGIVLLYDRWRNSKKNT